MENKIRVYRKNWAVYAAVSFCVIFVLIILATKSNGKQDNNQINKSTYIPLKTINSSVANNSMNLRMQEIVEKWEYIKSHTKHRDLGEFKQVEYSQPFLFRNLQLVDEINSYCSMHIVKSKTGLANCNNAAKMNNTLYQIYFSFSDNELRASILKAAGYIFTGLVLLWLLSWLIKLVSREYLPKTNNYAVMTKSQDY